MDEEKMNADKNTETFIKSPGLQLPNGLISALHDMEYKGSFNKSQIQQIITGGERRIVISDNAASEGKYGEDVFIFDDYEYPAEKLIRTAARMRPDKVILEGRSAGIDDPGMLLPGISYEQIKEYSLDDIYDRADNTAFGDPRLKAKDEALYQMAEYIQEKTGVNPYREAQITGGSTEDMIFDYIEDEKLLVRFDERGNISELVEAEAEHEQADARLYCEEEEIDI